MSNKAINDGHDFDCFQELDTSKLQDFDLKEILKQILFQAKALEFLNIKMKELHVRKDVKDPRVMAQLYQQMDVVREKMFHIDEDRASRLLRQIRSATTAFIKVRTF